MKMKRLDVTITCMAVYDGVIDVPADLSLEEAIDYARDRLNEVPLGELEYVPDSDMLDEDNCFFRDEPEGVKEADSNGTMIEVVEMSAEHKGLPSWVIVSFGEEEDREYEDILSDTYGFCISAFDEINPFDGGVELIGIHWDIRPLIDENNEALNPSLVRRGPGYTIIPGVIDEDTDLPISVMILSRVSSEFVDILSDEYGFCISGFDTLNSFDDGSVAIDGIHWDMTE